MTNPLQRSLVPLIATLASAVAFAGSDAFETGPLIEEFGPVAHVEGASPIPEGVVLRVAFDVSEPGEQDAVNRRLETAARFLNMHAAAGVAPERLSAALVVHGRAALDLVTARRRGAPNPNAALVAALIDAGVTIEMCGQAAARHDIEPDDLLDGVKMSLSAMTSHALLQQQGYTLNPY